MAAPVLRVVRIDGSEEIVPLDRDSIAIGKGPKEDYGNDVILEDVTVSRRHARVTRSQDGWFIEDLGSRNHTFVNDERAERRRLADGDRITIGLTTIVFEDGSERSLDPESVAVRSERLDRSSTIDLNYMILERVSEIVAGAADRDEFFGEVLEMLMKSVRAQAGEVFLATASGLEVRAARGGQEALSSLAVATAARTLAERRALVVEEGEGRTVHALAAPLVRDGKAVGAIRIENRREPFSSNDLVLATAVANQAAAGLERVALNQRIREETLVRSNLERFFSPAVAARIARDSEAGGGLPFVPERTEATIMFTDIRSFTSLAESLGPARVAELLGAHFELVTEIVFAHGGVLDKFIGDSIMALFGVPEHSPDHAARAIDCASRILEAHEGFRASLPEKERFDIRVGVNSGEVVAGYFGAPRRREYTVFGSPVVVAKRLESLAEPGTVLVGGATVALAGQEGLVRVEGLVEPKSGLAVEAWRPRAGGGPA